MKRVTLNAYQVGLVFKKGAYTRMLKEGSYWLWPSERIDIYDITKPFTPAYELNILLQDRQLADALHFVEVKDHEIVLQYENGLLKQVAADLQHVQVDGIRRISPKKLIRLLKQKNGQTEIKR
jgi:hypothetical protein